MLLKRLDYKYTVCQCCDWPTDCVIQHVTGNNTITQCNNNTCTYTCTVSATGSSFQACRRVLRTRLCVPSGSLRSGVHQTQDLGPLLDRPVGQRAGPAPPYPRRPPVPGRLGRPPARPRGECGVPRAFLSGFGGGSGAAAAAWDCANFPPLADPEEAVERQHVGRPVRCVGERVRGVSAPELQEPPPLRQEQRAGAAGTRPLTSVAHTELLWRNTRHICRK